MAAFGAPTSAQHVAAVHLRVDNDFFAMRLGRPPMDFDYTSGLEIGIELDGAPAWASRLVAEEQKASTLHLSLGQRIYTPRSRGERDIPGRRPYAGWLFGAAEVRSESDKTVRVLRIEVGVTGPPALAEETQNSLHILLGSERLPGWENQLPTEPGFAAQYDVARRFHLVEGDDAGIEIRPGVGLGLGTIWSGTRAGAGVVAGRGAFTLFMGFQGEWVWRNEFLDGTAFRSSESTPKIPIVGQFDYGVRLRLGQFGATARFVTRSREYDGQPSSHLYGSLTASLYF